MRSRPTAEGGGLTPNQRLETRYVRLRELTRADVPTLYAWRADPEYLATCTSRGHVSIETFAEELELDFKAERVQQFLVMERSTDIPVGTVYAYDYRAEDAYISITIFLTRNSRDQGYGPDAIGLMLRYLFEERQLYKVYMDVYETNSRSVQLLEKFGLRREGSFERQHWTGETRCAVFRYAAFADETAKIEAYLAGRV